MVLSQQAGNCIVAGLFLLVLSGCSLFIQDIPLSSLEHVQVSLENVPFFPQEQYQCGPAALAMVLGWSGITVLPDEAAQYVYSPKRRGSLQPALISAARRYGRVAYPVSGLSELTAELAAGHPVVVLLNLGFFWYSRWHYAVAVGYDAAAGDIILHSGTTEHQRLSFRVFDNLWKRSERWGLLVLPPSALPAEADEIKWMEATVGLERAAQWTAAATAYEAAISRWPTSFTAWLGLGNSKYAGGNLDGAAAAFRQAISLQAHNGIAFNNLAQVLSELGERDQALAAARTAVSLDGPQVETFRQTLSEIEGEAPESK
jgi:tetratricopeptide (TPR) repeat protein